jgi:hypothetical protein
MHDDRAYSETIPGAGDEAVVAASRLLQETVLERPIGRRSRKTSSIVAEY